MAESLLLPIGVLVGLVAALPFALARGRGSTGAGILAVIASFGLVSMAVMAFRLASPATFVAPAMAAALTFLGATVVIALRG